MEDAHAFIRIAILAIVVLAIRASAERSRRNRPDRRPADPAPPAPRQTPPGQAGQKIPARHGGASTVPAPSAGRGRDGLLCAGSVISGRCRVIDGDTIVIEGQNIRLAGIDAPELDHPWGRKSKYALVALCRGQTVKARITGELSHDRLVAICLLPDGRDLSAEMVRLGHALDWPKYSGGRYRHLEPPDARRRLWRADARQKGRFPPQAPGPAPRP